MPTIVVTAEVQALIRSQARADIPFRETAVRLPNGNYSVPVRTEVFEKLNEVRLAGESHSDCLLRLMSGRAN